MESPFILLIVTRLKPHTKSKNLQKKNSPEFEKYLITICCKIYIGTAE